MFFRSAVCVTTRKEGRFRLLPNSANNTPRKRSSLPIRFRAEWKNVVEIPIHHNYRERHLHVPYFKCPAPTARSWPSEAIVSSLNWKLAPIFRKRTSSCIYFGCKKHKDAIIYEMKLCMDSRNHGGGSFICTKYSALHKCYEVQRYKLYSWSASQEKKCRSVVGMTYYKEKPRLRV